MEVLDGSSLEEDEANFFAAELLLDDNEVLENLSEYSFFETAQRLFVPAALLDYKFSLWIYQCAESACPVFWKSPVRKEEIMVSDR